MNGAQRQKIKDKGIFFVDGFEKIELANGS